MLDELRQLYQEVILDHSRSPRHFGKIENATHHAEGDNPVCGDHLDVYVIVNPKTQIIEDVQFEGRGCAISTASASLMTEMMIGKSQHAAEDLFAYFHALLTSDKEGEIQEKANAISAEEKEICAVLAGVKQFPMRVKCATLAWHTIHAALHHQTEISTE